MLNQTMCLRDWSSSTIIDSMWSKTYKNRSYNCLTIFIKLRNGANTILERKKMGPKTKNKKQIQHVKTVNITESHGRQEKLCLNEK